MLSQFRKGIYSYDTRSCDHVPGLPVQGLPRAVEPANPQTRFNKVATKRMTNTRVVSTADLHRRAFLRCTRLEPNYPRRTSNEIESECKNSTAYLPLTSILLVEDCNTHASPQTIQSLAWLFRIRATSRPSLTNGVSLSSYPHTAP